MAFSREQAGRVRAGVVIALLVLALALAAAVLSGAFAPLSGASGAGSASSSAADSGQAANGDHSVADIDATYEPLIHQLQAKCEEDPDDPAAMLALANGYFDWGMAAMGHASSEDESAHVEEIFGAGVERYDAYLQANSSKSAEVDRAICLFYAGDRSKATSDLEAFVSRDGSFAPAWANLGMFYESEGDLDRAANAYRRAIEAAGDADTYGVTEYARQRLDALDR